MKTRTKSHEIGAGRISSESGQKQDRLRDVAGVMKRVLGAVNGRQGGGLRLGGDGEERSKKIHWSGCVR
jgi:hypothetical protein